MPVVRLDPKTGAVLGQRDGHRAARGDMPDLSMEADALCGSSTLTILANGDVALFHKKHAHLLRVVSGEVIVQTFATPSILHFVDTGAAFVGTTDETGHVQLVVIPWPSADAGSVISDLVLEPVPSADPRAAPATLRFSMPVEVVPEYRKRPSLLDTLESHAGTVAIPSDVRALFAAIDADPELRDSIGRLGVELYLNEHLRRHHDEVVLLWASPYDDNFVALDRAGKVVRAFRPSEDGWESAGGISTVLGDLLVDAAKAATAEFVATTLDRAKIPLPKKVRRAFKSLAR